MKDSTKVIMAVGVGLVGGAFAARALLGEGRSLTSYLPSMSGATTAVIDGEVVEGELLDEHPPRRTTGLVADSVLRRSVEFWSEALRTIMEGAL